MDTPNGLSMLFYNGAWMQSKVIIAQNGTNGFMIDDEGIYYMIEGIGLVETKVQEADILEIINVTVSEYQNAGSQTSNIEALQKRIDAISHISLGTGVINPQKFCGHVTDNGTKKIFFYDLNNNLSCIQSNSSNFWAIADNF